MIRLANSMPRELQSEMMDQPDLERSVHLCALRGLVRLNRLTGVAAEIYARLRAIALRKASKTLRLLDIASGSGDLPIAWLKCASRDGWRLHVTTLDRSGVAIEEQLRRARAAGVVLASIQQDCLAEPLPTGFDVCTNSLFLHHLQVDEVEKLLPAMMRSASESVIVCDLERSHWNRRLVMLGSRLVTRSEVMHVDARRSIEGAFTRRELKSMIGRACGVGGMVQSLWPCRMIAELRLQGSTCGMC